MTLGRPIPSLIALTMASCGGTASHKDPIDCPDQRDEVCNLVDDDCDGLVDEGFDVDGDGWTSCGGDCADANASQNPGLVESCNGGLDDDCDEETKEEADLDRDGYSMCDGDCEDHDEATFPGAVEVCDGLDNDCDPATAELGDADGDGASICDGDCDDSAPAISPSTLELCNGFDDDCDDDVDEGFPDTNANGIADCAWDGWYTGTISVEHPYGDCPFLSCDHAETITVDSMQAEYLHLYAAFNNGGWIGPLTMSATSPFDDDGTVGGPCEAHDPPEPNSTCTWYGTFTAPGVFAGSWTVWSYVSSRHGTFVLERTSLL